MSDNFYGLFAYGSLLNLESFEQTLGKKYLHYPRTCIVQGWRRSWDTAMPNDGFYEEFCDSKMIPERIMYMNVRRSPGDSINGLVYAVSEEELQAFDRREWTYNRILVDWTAVGGRSSLGKAYMYVADPQWNLPPGKPRTWAAVRKTYLDLIAHGVANLGKSFERKYKDSTDHIPQELIFADKFSGTVGPSYTETTGI